MNKFEKCATNINIYLKNMFRNITNISIENNNNSSKFTIIINNNTIYINTCPTIQFYANDNIATIEVKIRIHANRCDGVFVHTYERLFEVICEMNKNVKWNDIIEKHKTQRTFAKGYEPIYYNDRITPQSSQKCSIITLNDQH